MTDSPKVQQLMDRRAVKLIRLYSDRSKSMAEICTAMGWNTNWPNQMVAKEIGRLRKRGIHVPLRSGLPR